MSTYLRGSRALEAVPGLLLDGIALGDGWDAFPKDDPCEHIYAPGTMKFYRMLAMTFLCILGAALAAGLTMGLISLDELELRILVECSEDDCETQEEREELRKNQAYAKRVLPLVTRHHELLVTLLLLNSLANESMPLFLDSLVPSWVAIILSVSFILIFGEVIPSAIFTGSQGLMISSTLCPLVYVAMVITYPIVGPIAWCLDRWLEHKPDAGGRYNKAQLLALLRLHTQDADGNPQPSPSLLASRYSSRDFSSSSAALSNTPNGNGSGSSGHRSSESRRPTVTSESLNITSPQKRKGLLKNEVKMMKGAMNLRGTRAGDVMTPIDSVFTLDIDDRLDYGVLARIVEKGHSRIPIIANGDTDDIRGILLTKKLTALSPEEGRPVGSFPLRVPTFVHVDDPLSTVLRTLNVSRSHLAIVTDNPREMGRRFDRNGIWQGTPNINSVTIDHATDALFTPAPRARFVGVVALLDIIQQLVDEKLAEDDYFVPPLSESLLGSSGRWSFAGDDQPPAGVAVPVPMPEPRVVAFGRLRAWATAVRSRFSTTRKYSQSGNDLEQALLSASLQNSFHGDNPFNTRRVSFSETVEVVQFPEGYSGASELAPSGASDLVPEPSQSVTPVGSEGETSVHSETESVGPYIELLDDDESRV